MLDLGYVFQALPRLDWIKAIFKLFWVGMSRGVDSIKKYGSINHEFVNLAKNWP